MTYLTYLNYVTGSSATSTACCHARFTVPNHEEHAKKVKNILLPYAENIVKESYIYSAVNIELHAKFNHSFTFSYISSAGGFHPQRVQCLPQLLTVKDASGFSILPAPTHTNLFTTSNCCGL